MTVLSGGVLKDERMKLGLNYTSISVPFLTRCYPLMQRIPLSMFECTENTKVLSPHTVQCPSPCELQS